MAEVDTAEVAVMNIISDNISTLKVAKNLFRGPVRAPTKGKIPGEAVFALETGGPPPETCISANSGPDIRTVNVQVRVRSCPNDYASGKDLSELIWRSCQRATRTGYMSFLCLQSSAIYLGKDDTEHHEWAINVETQRDTQEEV